MAAGKPKRERQRPVGSEGGTLRGNQMQRLAAGTEGTDTGS